MPAPAALRGEAKDEAVILMPGPDALGLVAHEPLHGGDEGCVGHGGSISGDGVGCMKRRRPSRPLRGRALRPVAEMSFGARPDERDDEPPHPYFAADMRAFDALPPSLRRFLDEYRIGVSVQEFLRLYGKVYPGDERDAMSAIRQWWPA